MSRSAEFETADKSITMDPALRNAKSRYIYADYRTSPGDLRWKLVDGIACAMAPAPLRIHQEIHREGYRQAANALKGKPCRFFIAPFDIRLAHSNEANDGIETVVQPNLVAICDRNKFDERGCRGAPDWVAVAEILSPSAAGHDLIIKRRLAA